MSTSAENEILKKELQRETIRRELFIPRVRFQKRKEELMISVNKRCKLEATPGNLMRISPMHGLFVTFLLICASFQESELMLLALILVPLPVFSLWMKKLNVDRYQIEEQRFRRQESKLEQQFIELEG